MGVMVDLIDEIRNRLETATGVGLALENVKRVRIGSLEEARKFNDFPIININLVSGTDTPRSLPHAFTNDMQLEVSLLTSKLALENNKLYDTGTTSGPLYLFEEMLNTIDKNTSGDINLVFGTAGFNLREYSYDIDQSSDIIVMSVIINVSTREFDAGAR